MHQNDVSWHEAQVEKSNIEQARKDGEGRRACAKYGDLKTSKCCNENGKLEFDNYPSRAESICNKFMDMYKSSDKVICVANCLTEMESNTQEFKSCDLRNAARLVAHTDCYAKCSFFPNYFKENFGVPDGGWGIGIKELFPAFRDVGLGNANIE